MPKSKLELYQEILEALMEKPMNIKNLASATTQEDTALKQRLIFLTRNNLIEQQASGKKTTYAISERGTNVVKALSLQRHLEKVKDTIIATQKTA